MEFPETLIFAKTKKQNERYKRIIEWILQKDHCTIDVLSKEMKTSPATLRRDIVLLSQFGIIEKYWGGFRLSSSQQKNALIPSFSRRVSVAADEKKKLAEAAFEFIRDGETIFIDGGTTTLELVSGLIRRSIKIITNSIQIAYHVESHPKTQRACELIVAGGSIYPESYLLVGPQAVQNILYYHADWFIFSSAGITAEGIWNHHELAVDVQRAMMKQSERKMLLIDSHKIGKKSLVFLSDLHSIDKIITTASKESFSTLHTPPRIEVNFLH